jgi:hypothetical protein
MGHALSSTGTGDLVGKVEAFEGTVGPTVGERVVGDCVVRVGVLVGFVGVVVGFVVATVGLVGAEVGTVGADVGSVGV